MLVFLRLLQRSVSVRWWLNLRRTLALILAPDETPLPPNTPFSCTSLSPKPYTELNSYTCSTFKTLHLFQTRVTYIDNILTIMQRHTGLFRSFTFSINTHIHIYWSQIPSVHSRVAVGHGFDSQGMYSLNSLDTSICQTHECKGCMWCCLRMRCLIRQINTANDAFSAVYVGDLLGLEQSSVLNTHLWPWSTKAVISCMGVICSNSQQYIVWVKIIHFYFMPKIIRILRSCSMKIFCKFPTVNISKLNFWLVICIAKNFIWTTLKMIFSIFRFFCTLRFQIYKYCPIITNHTSMEILFIQLSDHA